MRFFYCFSLITLIVFLSPGSLKAQTEKPIRFERFTIEQGLSSNRIYSLTQDQDGYLWIATESGFSKYDGYGFKTYQNILGDPNSLVNNHVNSIYADTKNTIWIGTQNGLSRYYPNRNYFNNDNDIPGRVVMCIYASPSGDLWLGTDNGLTKYDPETDSFNNPWEGNSENPSLKGTTINSISEDNKGFLWIGTSSMGVVVLNPRDNSVIKFADFKIPQLSLPSSNVSNVLVTSSGDIWMAFLPLNGLVRFNPQTKAIKHYIQNSINQPEIWNRVSDILETEDHTIWVTTYHAPERESGLHRYDPNTDLFTRFTFDPYDPSSLSWPYAQCIFEDKDNNLWVGTSRGLNKADLNKWQMGHMRVNPKDPMSLVNNFYAIEEVNEDVFWLGLDGEGLVEWDRKTNKKTVHTDKNIFLLEGIHAMQKDIDGLIWLGYSGRGLMLLDTKRNQIRRFVHDNNDSKSLVGNYVTDILLDRNNELWITTSDGLSRYNREQGNFTNWRKDENHPQMSGSSLGSIFQDSKGSYWIGTRKHVYDPRSTLSTGLMKFDPLKNEFKSYLHDSEDPSSISSDMIYCVNEDMNGDIWVGTNNGLNRLDSGNNKFEVFLEPEGLPDSNIIGMLVDDSGILWLSTLNGLSRFDPVSKKFRNYSKKDGVQNARFNEGSFYKSRKGELIFGGVAGTNYFQPSEITIDTLIPKIIITEFLVQNQQVRFSRDSENQNNPKLKWHDNSLGFEFVSINFRAPEQTQYEYRLEGFEKEWINLGTRHFVNYTNLNPGSYTFRVRAISAEGVYTEQDATLSFRILPPVWQAWYAYIFYVILVLMSLFLVDRYQRKKLMRNEQERTRDRELAQAKEIEKAYTVLKSTQTQLIQAEKMASLGELTAGIAHEIQNPLNFVNNFSDVSTELLDEMLEEIEEGNLDDVKEISADLKQNLEKINHHGNRADSIVKGMLQHSRASNGIKELVDINVIADEYLRLSYHGLRAKDKSFNASLNTDFDPEIGKISIVPQDIGRVLLNLLTNAFYAVNEKKQMNEEGFEPTVGLTTKKEQGQIEIVVRDNGNGIPQSVIDKIFHPFFTTKPSGQGTGLGLSMSYDIITKGHSGKLKVNTKEGEYTEFIITLPIQNQ